MKGKTHLAVGVSLGAVTAITAISSGTEPAVSVEQLYYVQLGA